MTRLQRLLRQWLDVDARHREIEKTRRTLDEMNRQVSALRGLLHQQSEFTVEALHRAGWQSDDDVAQQKLLHRALRAIESGGDVIAGPWTGEVGFELLYWIPFLNWLAAQGLDRSRLVVVSRGGAAPWYAHLASRYVDVLDYLSPDEFRERTAAGKRKQFSPKRELDQEVLQRVRTDLNIPDAALIHPGAMFRLFTALWRNRATIDLVDSFTAFQRLTERPAAALDAARGSLPRDYVVAKFYFSRAFPETPENRAFVADLLREVSRQAPVALLTTSVRMDDHHDFAPTSSSGLFVVDALDVPQKNLERQTDLIAGSRGFIGTYGGFSYLAPFYGRRSVSFFSRRHAFKTHHLDLANRIFDRLLPGGFLALDRRAIELVRPAVAGWAAPAGAADPRAEAPAEAAAVKEDALT